MTPTDALLKDATWGTLQTDFFHSAALSTHDDIAGTQWRTIRQLWTQTIESYLSDELWTERDRYDASHVLMVPMEAAFQLDIAEWQQQFADHIGRGTEFDHNQTTDNIGKLQYFYFVSRFTHLAAVAQKWELVDSRWLTRLYTEVERWWNHEEVGNWGTRSFPGGIRQRVLWKLDQKHVELSYHRAITDFELHLIAIAAELRAFERMADGPTAYTPLLDDMLAIGKRIFADEGVWQSDGGWLFQPGVYADHSTYLYAGHTEMIPGMAQAPVPGIAEDTAHASRYPIWLTSLADASEPGSADRSFYERLRHGFGTQVVNHVLVPPSDSTPVYRLTNYMDGRNGVYRWNYATTGIDRGQGPYAMSRNLLNGWFAFAQHPGIGAVYSQLADQFPLSDAELQVYLPDVYSDRTFHPLVSVPEFYQNGMSELIVQLASRMSGWRPMLQTPTHRQLSPSSDAVAIAIDARDADSHHLSYSVDAQSIEYHLDQQFGFFSSGNLHHNWGGAGEKWIRGRGDQWFFIRPDGELVEWGGRGLTGTSIATLHPRNHDDPSRLYAAQANQASVWGEMYDGDTVMVGPSDDLVGTAAVVVQATDGRHRTQQLFVVDVVADRPILEPIGQQIVQANQGQLQLPLRSSGPRFAEHRYDVTAESLEAFLVNQLQLVSGVGSHFNWGGRAEKWLSGADGQWYFLLPNGGLCRWDGQSGATGELLVTLTPQHYERPHLMLTTHVPAPVIDVRVNDGVLQAEWPADYRGTYVLHVSVHDGYAQDREAVFVSVNHPPEWDLVGDVILADARQRLILPFSTDDSDGQYVRVASDVRSLEYFIDQSLGLFSTGDYHVDWGGRSEKWMMGDEGQWYFILPGGQLYAWDGTPTASGKLVESLSVACYLNPRLLHDALADSLPVQVSHVGAQLVVQAGPGFSGWCVMKLTATDGRDSLTQTVRLYVNQPPVLEPLNDQTAEADQGVLRMPLAGRDTEGDGLEYTAEAIDMAWALDREFDFVSSGRVSENYGGRGEKWILDSRRRWHFVTPDGGLYRWNEISGAADGDLIGRVGARVHADLSLLYAPKSSRAAVDVVVEGDLAILDLTWMSAEDFLLNVAVGDGLAWDRQSVRVSVV